MIVFLLLFLAQDPPPPLGKLVDVGGHRVHLHCTGEGIPTVMVVGGYSMDWALVQQDVARFTRICTYDVAGTAWSDPGPSTTCDERVTELHALISKSPVVLVGFSVGGLVVRHYAVRYPDEVKGVVFVDHAFTPPRPSPPKDLDNAPVLIFQTPIEFTVEDTSDFKTNLPARAQKLHEWAAARKPPVDQAKTADSCLAELKHDALGSRPLVVVSTGNQAPGYKELQTRLLGLSSNSQQMLAERSFHSIEIDQPGVVVSAIRRVVEEVRTKPSVP